MPQMCRYPGHEYTRIKAKNKVTFSLYFSTGKGLVTYGTPLCPLFRKSRYSAHYGCSKNYFVSFLLYIDLVFCFFAPEKERRFGSSGNLQLKNNGTCNSTNIIEPFVCLFCCFTAMVIAGRSVHVTTPFPGQA